MFLKVIQWGEFYASRSYWLIAQMYGTQTWNVATTESGFKLSLLITAQQAYTGAGHLYASPQALLGPEVKAWTLFEFLHFHFQIEEWEEYLAFDLLSYNSSKVKDNLELKAETIPYFVLLSAVPMKRSKLWILHLLFRLSDFLTHSVELQMK